MTKASKFFLGNVHKSEDIFSIFLLQENSWKDIL